MSLNRFAARQWLGWETHQQKIKANLWEKNIRYNRIQKKKKSAKVHSI
jgi:hypothetical protein